MDSSLILGALDIKAGQTVLDAGCGNGYMSKIFSDAMSGSGTVYALDPDAYFIEILKGETKGSNIQARVGDITRHTGIEDKSLDLLYMSTVIHAFSMQHIQGVVKEAKRLLKQEALLAIVEMEKRETPFGPPLENRYSPEELKNIIPMVPGKTVPVGKYFYMQIFYR